PERQSPFVDMKRATQRRNVVLQRMADEGYITQAQADTAKQTPIVTRGQPTQAPGIAPFFVEEVRKHLERQYGAKVLYENGLSVTTTLDAKLQEIANRTIEHGLRAYDKRHGWRRPRRNVLAEDHTIDLFRHAPANRTGQIKAMVGGWNFNRSKFNRAVQAYRQIGSTFKPIVYTAAIDRGFTPTSILIDAPVSYAAGNGQIYSPHNYDHKFQGPIT